jgi:hypothetical protein
MRADLFQPTVEAEARLLLLIEAFSRKAHTLEGRTKLAKLDFFLRYPLYLKRALAIRNVPEAEQLELLDAQDNIEARMVRYRYGPWDPAYYAILGRLIGKGLVESVPIDKGIGYKATEKGIKISHELNDEEVWHDTTKRLDLLKKHLNLSGSTLKQFIYSNFPEVAQASWGQSL